MNIHERNAARPTSPHLQVYQPQLTSVLSILHRISGVALSGGALLLVYWLASIAGGEASFARANGILFSFFGQVLLFLFSLAAFLSSFVTVYGTCTGILVEALNSNRCIEVVMS